MTFIPTFSILAHNIRSLHNVGSIFRTADGAGVDQVFLTGYTGTPPRIQIDKVALGAQESIPWKHYKHPLRKIRSLKQAGVQIVALETGDNSVDLFEFEPTWPVCLLVGNEVTGIDDKLLGEADVKVSIAMMGMKESLNVSCAFAVAVYEMLRKSRNTKD